MNQHQAGAMFFLLWMIFTQNALTRFDAALEKKERWGVGASLVILLTGITGILTHAYVLIFT